MHSTGAIFYLKIVTKLSEKKKKKSITLKTQHSVFHIFCFIIADIPHTKHAQENMIVVITVC